MTNLHLTIEGQKFDPVFAPNDVADAMHKFALNSNNTSILRSNPSFMR